MSRAWARWHCRRRRPTNSRERAACGHISAYNRKTRDHFACRACGHEAHADVNAAEVLTARGEAAEALWEQKGRPLLVRPKPRLRRRKAEPQQGAGSVPHAVTHAA